ncbi:MAG: trypsin-like peptidase domain-containing protein [Bauldia sp.]
MRIGSTFRAVRAAAMTAACVGGVIVLGVGAANAQQAGIVDRVVPQTALDVRLSFAPIVQTVSPAVVNVYARQLPENRDAFWEQFGNNARMRQSLGSGVIVDASGIVITNFHVIADANDIRIAMTDGTELPAEILLVEEQLDLAVLRIPERDEPYPMVPLDDSDKLLVGDLVLAIGNPFGVGQTVTSGIVSALGRTLARAEDNQFFIQTDAAIIPGNSGGALVDLGGGLVGINTAIYSRNGASVGIGFAIPSNLVALVIHAALNGDTLHRPWIGAGYTPLTLVEAEEMGLRSNHGAVVTFVTPDSPAAMAGLAVGDAVLTVNGMAIDHPSGLTYRMLLLGLEGEVTLGIARGNERLDLAVVPAEAPETVPRDALQLPGRTPFTGATLLNLSPLVAQEVGYAQEPVGVIVSAVLESSFAATAGLAPGDVIASVNGTAITDTAQLAELIVGGGTEWLIEVLRDGRMLRSSFSLRR